jgi:hypothetical protein
MTCSDEPKSLINFGALYLFIVTWIPFLITVEKKKSSQLKSEQFLLLSYYKDNRSMEETLLNRMIMILPNFASVKEV